MDITFEDVAHVIQDARYQQAILDTTPRPDKRIPFLPRGFNVQQYVDKQGVSLRTVMSEPLGRWFLDKFCDLEDKVSSERERKPVGPREESAFLRFVASVYEVRRQDPESTAPFEEVLGLLHESKVDRLSSVRMVLGNPARKEMATLLEAAIREANSASYLDSRRTLESGGGSEESAGGGVGGSGSGLGSEEEDAQALGGDDNVLDEELVELDEEGSRAVSASAAAAAAARGGHGGGGQGDAHETQVSRYKGRATAGGGGGAGTTKEGGVARATTGGRLLQLAHRGASMRQHSARTVSLNQALQQLMEAVLQPVYDRFVVHRAAFAQYLRFSLFAHKQIGDRQIRYHRLLGQGAFGSVHGCIVAQTGTMLAMKIMSKKRIKVKHSKSQVSAERFALEALAIHPSPYCMRLRYAYQTKDAFHLVLPLAIGGDLKFHLRQGPFDEKRAKVYAAEIAVGVGHIHSLGFIMRDLKPRNILLDSDGHCKISDFGLAASIADGRQVKGRAGTEGYWSVAVIDSQPYGIDADWWSYGCCVFELLAGFNPFSCKHTGLATRNEGTRKAPIRFTKHVPNSAKPLINGLLNRDVAQRLGCGGAGVDEFLNARFAFWRGLDLGKIRRGNHPVPWLPEKGVIYAASQSEMMENEDDPNGASMRKVKLTRDDIPEFDDFVDLHDHMDDIVKVLELNTDVLAIFDALKTGAPPPSSDPNLRSKNVVLQTADAAQQACSTVARGCSVS
jgi:serine/threonine protein kinase